MSRVIFFIITLLSILSGDEKVVLQLDWKHQFEYVGYYMAKEKGFYKDVGLDVEIREFSGTDPISALLESDEVNYGSYSSKIILSKMKGEPLVLLANIFKKSALVLVAQDNIRTPMDFYGKKIMGSSDQLRNGGLGTLFQRFGLSSSSYQQVDPTFRIDEFRDGKVDVMTAYVSNELFHLNHSGVKYNIIDPANYGIYMYGDSLFTKASELEENRERTENFRVASIRGWSYAINNIEESVDTILKRYNTQNKSREALLFEAEETVKMVMPKIYPVGSIDKNRIHSIADTFVEIGVVDNNYSLRGLLLEDFTNQSKQFTSEERRFLSRTQKITMCVDPDWMPYEKIEDGKHIGIGGDYMRVVSDIIGTPLKLVVTENWSDSLDHFYSGECDILSLVRESPSQREYMSFTEPYFSFPLVIATDVDELFVSKRSDLEDKRLGVVSGYATYEVLTKLYPELEIVEVKSVEEGMDMVVNGELFGFIDTLPTVGYTIQKGYHSQLKIGGKLSNNWDLSIGIRKDMPLLASILNKAVRAIPESQKQNIINQWISVKYETSSNSDLIVKIVVIFLIIILLIVVKYFVTQKYNKILEAEVEKQLEELRKKDVALINQNKLASMGEMVGSIAHQWKQPLNVLSMNIEMLIDDYDDGLVDEEFINKFRDDNIDVIRFMVTTIDDFRNFFRVEKEKQKFDVKDAITKISEMQRVYLKKRDVDLIITGESFYTFGFKTEFQQVILNLINNAKDEMVEKEMHNGKIEVEILKDGFVRVRDNAGGIPAEIIDQIFNPYFTTKEEGKGTGIGLHMSRTIIEEHLDGKLSVRNVESGAEFQIELKTI
jgi:signal transduction histidine kinase/ABC-type nitrate/sulfonate/bicarbonate transport system substrate-binding protein